MTYLFIGGNSDGEEIAVPGNSPIYRVADKPKHTLALGDPIEPRGYSTYIKRTYRRGSWVIVHYFAAAELTDQQAHQRFLECMR